MIKNVLKRFFGVGIFILFGCCFSSCFAYNTANVEETKSFEFYNGLTIFPDSLGNFNTSDGNNINNVFYILSYDMGNTNWYSRRYMYISYDGVGLVVNRKDWTTFQSGYIDQFRISTYSDLPNLNRYDWGVGTGTFEDVIATGIGGHVTDILYNQSQVAGSFCYRSSDLDLSICFRCSGGIQMSDCVSSINDYSQADTDNTNTSFYYLNSSEFLNSSLVSSSSNGGTLIPTSTDVDVAINYYETTKGFNENMCYVGTNNLTADFGTAGISFEEGTGSTIFELYNSQFSGFGNNIITNVGKFINVRTFNYGQWFYEGDNIKRLATDNGPDSGVSYIYTGFTFPFANKPIAIFFMASNLLDGYFTQQSMGNDVAFYCYIKLNYTSLSNGDISYTGDVLPLVPPAIQNNVEDHFKYQLNYGNSGYYYSPDWIGSFSGDYELSDNLELDGVFTNFLNNFNAKLGNIDFGYTIGIIPDWILFPLIFLILFRIMKH